MITRLFGSQSQEGRAALEGLSAEHREKAEDLLSALAERPGDLRARRSLGDVYKAGGKIDDAVEQYQALVGAYAAQGLFFRAIAACKLVLEIKPDHEESSRALADLYARRTPGKESAELPRAMSAALTPSMEGDPVSIPDGEVAMVPPPLPDDADDEIVDIGALVGALTPLAEGAVRLERPPSVPLFSGLSADSFQALVKKLSAWEAEPGAVIVGEGEESDGVYVVVRGAVRVERAERSATGTASGEVTVLARLGPDSFFGEMALLSRKPRAASVVAEVKTELLEIPRAVLEELVEKDPGVAQALESFSRSRLLDTLARTSPVLAQLPEDVVKAALAGFDSRRCAAGETVVKEGGESVGLFVVLQGDLDVVAKQEIGTTRLKRLGPGDVFGEMSLVFREVTSASVVAASDCALLVLPKESFEAFAQANPALDERLRALAEQRKAFNEKFLVPDETSSAVLV